MWSVLVFVILCLHIGYGTSNQVHDSRSYQKGYVGQSIQNFNSENGFNNSPLYTENAPLENPRNRRAGAPKSCTKSKPFVKNAFKKCSSGSESCTVQCFNNYQFSNGQTSVKLICNAGEWTLENVPKTDKPACEPICNPPCKNGGVCTEPATCKCPENFEGTRCEKEKEGSCSNDPETQQAQAQCKSNNCTISCEEGHTFPDGSTTMEMTCINGEWLPTNPEQSFAPTCQPMCENGRVYKECSKMSEQSCGSKAEQGSEDDECFEGCFCPFGTAEHSGQCIPIEDCPCNVDGKMYEPGSEMQKECNTCMCEKGEWKCSNKKCDTKPNQNARPNQNTKPKQNAKPNPPDLDPARCEVFGDPHYVTFDGKRYDFMGRCSYYLMRMESGMDIIAENGDCPWGHNEYVSCTKSVTISVPHNYNQKSMIRLKQGGRVEIDGIDQTRNLPIDVLGGLMQIWPVSPMARQVVCNDGLQMLWDGYTYAYIDAPASYSNKTNGLCGNFDNNPENDFMTPEGDAEVLPESFGEKWRVKEICDAGKEKKTTPHPCQLNVKNQQPALQVCQMLRSKLFAACHQLVDPEPYHKNCLYDMCACQGDAAQCKCTIFSAYANECSRRGKTINWRQSIKECAVKCPDDQIFDECSDRCHLSCADLQSTTKNCTNDCTPGCRCPDGKAFDENNKCIPREQCVEATEPSVTTEGTEPTTKASKPNRTTKPTQKPIRTTRPTKVPQTTKPTQKTMKSTLRPDSLTEPINTTEATEPAETTDATTDATEPNEMTTYAAETTEPTEVDSTETTESENTQTTDPNETTEIPEKADEVESLPKKKENSKMQCENKGKKYKNGDHIKNGCNDCVCFEGELFCKNPCETNNDKDHVNNQDASVEQDSNVDQDQTSNLNQKPNTKKDTEPDYPKQSAKKPRNNQIQQNPDSDCQIVPLNESETIGIIDIVLEPFGRCVNIEPITGFAECSGACKSSTTFNRRTLKHDENCGCCSISKIEKVPLSLRCDDGSEQRALVPIPRECACGTSCGADKVEETYYRNRNIEPIENSAETENQQNVNNALGWLFNAPRTFRINLRHREI